MRLSFPHMGTSVIPLAYLFEEMGHEVIRPDRPTGDTLTLGARYAPEFACIPFKLVLGTYLETLRENDVDVLLSGGGCGPCRAGYYGDLHRRILEDMGYDFEMIFFFPPLKTPRDTYEKIRRLKPGIAWTRLISILSVVWEKLKALDELEIRANQVRVAERFRGNTTKTFERATSLIDEARTRKAVRIARDEALALINQVPQVDTQEAPLKIGVIGEIYVQLEPTANFYLEEKLGELGAYVQRSLFLSGFTQTDVVRLGAKDIQELAKPYLPENVGGHGQNSIGETILYAEKGFDGVIQLAPFTCIPEIVAKSIIPSLSETLDLPVLTLFIDEQTGDAGVDTRLEAFTDLLRSKKRRARGQAEPVSPSLR